LPAALRPRVSRRDARPPAEASALDERRFAFAEPRAVRIRRARLVLAFPAPDADALGLLPAATRARLRLVAAAPRGFCFLPAPFLRRLAVFWLWPVVSISVSAVMVILLGGVSRSCGGGRFLARRAAAVVTGCTRQPTYACQHGKTEQPVSCNARLDTPEQAQIRIKQAHRIFRDLGRAHPSTQILHGGAKRKAAPARLRHSFGKSSVHDGRSAGRCLSQRKKMLSVRH
jgi:hypothetical protein